MADLEELIDRASRMMAAGWRGNPNMSGDDRDFMPPSQRRRHDDRVRSVVEFVLSESAKQKGEAEGWRAIESAPQDWQDVILFDASREREVFEGYYDKQAYRWRDAQNQPASPTSWRPLPEPPTMLSAGGEGQ